jgi:hypothetical protein
MFEEHVNSTKGVICDEKNNNATEKKQDCSVPEKSIQEKNSTPDRGGIRCPVGRGQTPFPMFSASISGPKRLSRGSRQFSPFCLVS